MGCLRLKREEGEAGGGAPAATVKIQGKWHNVEYLYWTDSKL